MPFLPSLPQNALLMDVFKAYPATSKPLLAYHEALMRGDSPLTVAERELIAAYCSGLNQCPYCYGVHSRTAERFGIPEDLLSGLIKDADASAVDDKLKPILRYVRKLTLEPYKIAQADADAVYAAGWDEKALHDAVSVCALFNLMNRFVSGHGIEADDAYFRRGAKRLQEIGYAGLVKMLNQP